MWREAKEVRGLRGRRSGAEASASKAEGLHNPGETNQDVSRRSRNSPVAADTTLFNFDSRQKNKRTNSI